MLSLAGKLCFPDATADLRQQSRELVADGEKQVVLDMLAVPWLDSSGIGEVVACYKRVREQGGTVKLVLREKPFLQFTFCHLEKMFDIYQDVDEAVASFMR